MGALELLAYLVMLVGVLALVIPLGLLLIRLLNETWLDPDWRAARRRREKISVESIILSERDPIMSSCGWAVLIQAAFTTAGTGLGAIVYLPGPLDGWFYFSMIIFGTGGAILGLIVNLFVAVFLGESE